MKLPVILVVIAALALAAGVMQTTGPVAAGPSGVGLAAAAPLLASPTIFEERFPRRLESRDAGAGGNP